MDDLTKVYSKIVNPFKINANTFSENTHFINYQLNINKFLDIYKKATLYVPPGTTSKYKATLIPNTNALREVVIYGERRFEKRMAQILKPSPQQIERDKMPKFVPAGISPLGVLLLIYDLTLRKKVEDHARRKKALKEVRQKEEEFKQKWDSLLLKKPEPERRLRIKESSSGR